MNRSIFISQNTPWLPRNASGNIKRLSQQKTGRCGAVEKTHPARDEAREGRRSLSPERQVELESADFFDSISDSCQSSSQLLRLRRGICGPQHPASYLAAHPARLWAPFYTHALPLPHKGPPPGYYEQPWAETDSIDEHSSFPSDSLEFELPLAYEALLNGSPSEGSRRKPPLSVLRIKRAAPERPSILAMGSLKGSTSHRVNL